MSCQRIIFFDEAIVGASSTVTYSTDKSTVNLNVDTPTSSYVIRQSKRVMSYQPGKSLLNLNTLCNGFSSN